MRVQDARLIPADDGGHLRPRVRSVQPRLDSPEVSRYAPPAPAAITINIRRWSVIQPLSFSVSGRVRSNSRRVFAAGPAEVENLLDSLAR